MTAIDSVRRATSIAREEILHIVTPFLVLTLLEFCGIALLMRVAFRVPIHGPFGVLLILMLPFSSTMPGLGPWISTCAATHDASRQMWMGTILPSIFLSGYVFLIDSMPWVSGWSRRGSPQPV
ncbi:ABC transporter permease [Tundrisphaera lichenicola]|uniref:ABC transporter permease n=1 Tax=Tundrisphaera lichenicola TaxID=2029860 RepID=UPI003EB7D6F4